MKTVRIGDVHVGDVVIRDLEGMRTTWSVADNHHRQTCLTGTA